MKPRPVSEINKIKAAAQESMQIEGEHTWENGRGEIFVHEEGELIAYTDTRVINHVNDRLVNLRNDPFSDELDSIRSAERSSGDELQEEAT